MTLGVTCSYAVAIGELGTRGYILTPHIGISRAEYERTL